MLHHSPSPSPTFLYENVAKQRKQFYCTIEQSVLVKHFCMRIEKQLLCIISFPLIHSI